MNTSRLVQKPSRKNSSESATSLVEERRDLVAPAPAQIVFLAGAIGETRCCRSLRECRHAPVAAAGRPRYRDTCRWCSSPGRRAEAGFQLSHQFTLLVAPGVEVVPGWPAPTPPFTAPVVLWPPRMRLSMPPYWLSIAQEIEALERIGSRLS